VAADGSIVVHDVTREEDAHLIVTAPTFADIAARVQHRANECGGDYGDIPREEVNAFLSELDDALSLARGEPSNGR
jgi:hypothetical protein